MTSDNKKHPLESVVEAFDEAIEILSERFSNQASIIVNSEKALTTLREYIEQDERVEGLEEAVRIFDDFYQAPSNLLGGMSNPNKIIVSIDLLSILNKAARIQLKRQEG